MPDSSVEMAMATVVENQRVMTSHLYSSLIGLVHKRFLSPVLMEGGRELHTLITDGCVADLGDKVQMAYDSE